MTFESADADRGAVRYGSRRMARLLKSAQMKVSASPEDVDFRTARGLDKRKFSALLSCDWIGSVQHVIVKGPTGVGKTWLTCALGQQAIRKWPTCFVSPF
ncbi:ATP-binding protein [Comamonas sp.]|uniref:ATP-binding protein n=1 Tax=Comamonas sp. TaxID=34028 RepID=UPI003A8C9583